MSDRIISVSMRALVVFVSVLFFAHQASAFEKKQVKYENAANAENKVYFEFNGEIFDSPLDLFEDKEIKQPDVKKIYDFFRRFYAANKDGAKKDVLALWNPGERPQIEKDLNDEAFSKNQARFKAMTGMKLKMIVDYGGFSICYIRMEFVGHKVVMKYPLILNEKGMFLSNNLNGDYFYDAISHFLDSENYKDILGQAAK